MKLWRLTRTEYQALDGKGVYRFGGRYVSPGRAVVTFASEAGLAVLVAVRYWEPALEDKDGEGYVLGWTETEAVPFRVEDGLDDASVKARVDEWIDAKRSLLIAIQSKVLPEADVILMNLAHPDSANIPPLTVRPFSFRECFHSPPMLDRYRAIPGSADPLDNN